MLYELAQEVQGAHKQVGRKRLECSRVHDYANRMGNRAQVNRSGQNHQGGRDRGLSNVSCMDIRRYGRRQNEVDHVARRANSYRPCGAATGRVRGCTIRDDDGQRRKD